MADADRVRFARWLELEWLKLFAMADGAAEGLGPVVEAVVWNNPEEALIRCKEGGVDEVICLKIREVFEIDLDGPRNIP